ncbi:c-di-AMP phosphodiesterase, consists of a GGDEF-like and DHH domains [Hathewaya proteolytica DSM 3090]|uniref:Cyclic-di-AMP phosphodiesterase n=1 Tax=Hathewaya proteolytica DSM 3090 TaxID=1121331 RepID=A0A1M6MPL6_9CLOT|nr:DHH family phosphoesterase [Hathewaya proteolytica]SHJ85382.1 c-di-AMP phosphodiesterase, consists of a GGDEF-like and DHH domains [Hathewaya proteolytica DSM 3090]
MSNSNKGFRMQSGIYILIIFCATIILFFYGHKVEAMILIGVIIVLIIYSLWKVKKSAEDWQSFVQDYSSKVNMASTSSFLNLPFPLLMLNEKGNIIWYNNNFSNILDNKNMLGQNIREISKDINVKYSVDGKKNTISDVKLKDRYFDVVSTVMDPTIQGQTTVLYYFYDVTENHKMKMDLQDNKYSIMLIEVDNLNDVLKTTDEDKSPLLAAEIERTINNYSQGLDAMVKKYATNKYVVTVQDKAIQHEIENKFSILDTVRELDYGNKLLVTLSIGVGRGNSTPQGNYSLAESAKELALGRGGDQVVVKTGDSISFFGGKSKEVEKKTKVKARVIALGLLDLIKESSRVIIMGHKNMDIDCLGASIGIHSSCRQLGIKSNIVYNESDMTVDEVKKSLMKEEIYENVFVDVNMARDIADEKTLLIIVDVHNENHVEDMKLVKKCSRVVIIDHHRRAADYIQDTILNYVEPYASSTSELVTEMIPYLVEKISLEKIEAVSMLAGIYLDTKSFYFKTGVRTFEAASTLRRMGADTIEVKKLFREDLKTIILKSDIMKSAEIFHGIALAVCPENISDSVIAAQVADNLLDIRDIGASFVLIKVKEHVLISGRSLDNLNVQIILEKLGGGGHMTMAGAKLQDVTLGEAKEKLKAVIEEYLQEVE